MARLGRLDRDLVVEAMETPGPRKRRMRLMARFLRAAMISGAQLVAVLVEDLTRDTLVPWGL